MKTPESATDNNVGSKMPENVPETNVGKINEIMPGAIKRELGEEIPVHYHLPNPEPRLTPKELMKLQQLHGAALIYIEQLENAVEFYGDRAQWLESRLAQVERERDAAVNDLPHNCWNCIYHRDTPIEEIDTGGRTIHRYCDADYCYPEEENNSWKWRGVCSENTKEET